MTGRPQKPYEALQNRRGDRRKTLVQIAPNLAVWAPAHPPRPRNVAPPREQAMIEATAQIERMFGRAAVEGLAELEAAAPPRGKRRYTPRSQRRPDEQKKQRAAARERDAKGHFVKRERPQET